MKKASFVNNNNFFFAAWGVSLSFLYLGTVSAPRFARKSPCLLPYSPPSQEKVFRAERFPPLRSGQATFPPIATWSPFVDYHAVPFLWREHGSSEVPRYYSPFWQLNTVFLFKANEKTCPFKCLACLFMLSKVSHPRTYPVISLSWKLPAFLTFCRFPTSPAGPSSCFSNPPLAKPPPMKVPVSCVLLLIPLLTT